MTICIAAFCQHEDRQMVICVADHMVSMGGYYSADDMTRKADPIGGNWCAMFAGDDISPVVPILRRMQRKYASETGPITLAVSRLLKKSF